MKDNTMEKILDQTSDANGAQLVELARLVELPDYVKNANLEDCRSHERLPPAAYADPLHRRYPGHTKAATWLSALYFIANRSKISSDLAAKVETNLDKAASFWGIQNAVVQLKNELTNKTAENLETLPDSDFAYVWVDEAGVKDRHLPIRNAAEVKAATHWLHQNQDIGLSFKDRSTIAVKILSKAAEYGAHIGGLDEFLQKQAGRGICDHGEVVRQLKMRVMHIKDATMRTTLQKLAEEVDANPSGTIDPFRLIDLATTVDMIDRSQRFTVKYASEESGIKRPEDFLFAITYDAVEKCATQHCELPTGTVYKVESFKTLKLADVQALLGKDLAEEVQSGLDVDAAKMAEIASTLPTPDAELLDQLMSQQGQQPVMKQASRDRIGFSRQNLLELASQDR